MEQLFKQKIEYLFNTMPPGHEPKYIWKPAIIIDKINNDNKDYYLVLKLDEKISEFDSNILKISCSSNNYRLVLEELPYSNISLVINYLSNIDVILRNYDQYSKDNLIKMIGYIQKEIAKFRNIMYKYPFVKFNDQDNLEKELMTFIKWISENRNYKEGILLIDMKDYLAIHNNNQADSEKP